MYSKKGSMLKIGTFKERHILIVYWIGLCRPFKIPILSIDHSFYRTWLVHDPKIFLFFVLNVVNCLFWILHRLVVNIQKDQARVRGSDTRRASSQAFLRASCSAVTPALGNPQKTRPFLTLLVGVSTPPGKYRTIVKRENWQKTLNICSRTSHEELVNKKAEAARAHAHSSQPPEAPPRGLCVLRPVTSEGDVYCGPVIIYPFDKISNFDCCHTTGRKIPRIFRIKTWVTELLHEPHIPRHYSVPLNVRENYSRWASGLHGA